MRKNSTPQSGIFNPRVLVAFALCSFGVLLGMFSLAATPAVETPRANTSLPPDPANFPSTFGSNANRLPPGVPLPPSGLDAPPGRKPGTQFSLLNGQGDPSSSSPTAGFLGVGGMLLRSGTASGANPLGNRVFANQQPAPLSMPRPAASGSIPLAPAAASGWSIVTSPNALVPKDALSGVTCVSASDCWAVGYSFSGSVTQTLVERWDGTSWAIVTSPNTSATQNNILYGVTCVSASECWALGAYRNGRTLIEEYTLTIPPLTGVVSELTHGSAGTFDIDLPLTGPRGVECRTSASLGAGNYAVVFTFANNVTNCGTAGTAGGSVSRGPNANQCTENLTGVTNAQYITVTLNNVLDSQNNTGTVSTTMGVLIGDVTGNGVVTNTDVGAVKAQVNPTTPVTQANFREDVTVNGFVTNTDVGLVKGQVNPTGGLPTPP